MSTRRAFLAGVTSVLVTRTLPSHSQETGRVAQPRGRISRVGILAGRSTIYPEAARLWEMFTDGLREFGYIEGKNIVFERRYYEDNLERASTFASELVRLQVDVIVTGASPAPEVAKSATSKIPIVMATHVDPLGSGLAVSLAKPGGNVTGTSMLLAELRGKQLQLLKETVPNLGLVAVLVDPTSSTYAREVKEVEAAARSLRMPIQVFEVRAARDLPAAFNVVAKERVGGLLIVGGTPLFYFERAQIAALGLQRRVPTMSGLNEFAAAGCLMSYGPSLADGYRRAAWYVDRILKGAKPGELPIEQPTKFVLTVNVRTAKALQLTIPASVLTRADALIE